MVNTKPTLKTKADRKAIVQEFALEYLSIAGTPKMISHEKYEKHKRTLIKYKEEVLKSLHGQVVECSATLHQRGKGTQGNLNTIVCVQINGILVDHLNIYDEFVEQAGAVPGKLFSFKARVYGYHRKKNKPGYGLKPVDMPLDRSRNEF